MFLKASLGQQLKENDLRVGKRLLLKEEKLFTRLPFWQPLSILWLKVAALVRFQVCVQSWNDDLDNFEF